MENTVNDYRTTLKEFFSIKKEMNPSYSLRSFARDLGMHSSNLSAVLNKRQGLSKETALQIVNRLNIRGDERQRFVDLVLAQNGRSKRERIQACRRLEENTPLLESNRKELQEDYFKLISDWYYYAILELVELDFFKSDSSWIADQIGESIDVVDNALARLIRLSLLKYENGIYTSTNCQLDTLYDIPSAYIKKHNAQLLQKAGAALIDQDVAEREFSTLTIAINQDDIDFVKGEIRSFKRSLDQKLIERNKIKKPNRVYGFTLQFFNLLKGDIA